MRPDAGKFDPQQHERYRQCVIMRILMAQVNDRDGIRKIKQSATPCVSIARFHQW